MNSNSQNLFHLLLNIVVIYFHAILGLFKFKKRKDISGQNVLITGSGHGLGRELALKFAKLNVNLILVDINEANNELVKTEILGNNNSEKLSKAEVFTYCIDIRNEHKVAELANQIKRDLGGVDILINNAGIVQCKPFLELSPELVERTIQINTLAHIWTIKNFLPGMIERGRGHVVAVASIAGLIGNKYLTDYCASKFAAVGLMEALDIELHDKGSNPDIHLTTICPASISTGMFKTLTSRFEWILPVLRADQVADKIINAILLNKTLVVIPQIAIIMHRLSMLVPKQVRLQMYEYFDYGVKPHKV